MKRVFVDHAGRFHRVSMTREEITEGVKYWAVFAATTLAFGIILTIASGILA